MDNIKKLLEGQKVEWRRIWEVTNWDKKFNGVDKTKQETVLKFKHVSAQVLKSLENKNGGDIKLLSTGNFEGYTVDTYAGDDINEGEVITIPTGGTANIKYYNGRFVDSGNLLATGKEGIETKYIYYFFVNNNELIQSHFRGSGVKHPDMRQILELPIPIPPLSTQREIVRILDTFIDHTAELTAELTARKKQYNYYRDKLLTFEEGEVEWRALGSVLIRTKGTKITANQMKILHKENAPLKIFAGGKTVAFVNFNDIPEKDVNNEPSIIVKSRGIIEFEYYDKPFSHKNEMWSYHSNDKNIDIKFIYYFLKISELHFQRLASKMQMPQIATPDTDRFPIPIPPLPIQKEIVAILDKFDSLTNSISEGLPKEIDLRKKQYEYYRNLLLTFKNP